MSKAQVIDHLRASATRGCRHARVMNVFGQASIYRRARAVLLLLWWWPSSPRFGLVQARLVILVVNRLSSGCASGSRPSCPACR